MSKKVTFLLMVWLYTPLRAENISPHMEAGADHRKHERYHLFDYKDLFSMESCLDNKQNARAVKEFTAWARLIIKNEYLPNDGYIEKYVILYPADGRTRKEDVAMLPFRGNDSDILIVQTGGIEGRLWIYVRNEHVLEATDKGEAEVTLNELLKTVIREEYRVYIPDMMVIDEPVIFNGNEQRAFIGKPRYGLRNMMRNFVQYGCIGKDRCIVLQKINFEGMQAHFPKPDKWFEYARLVESESSGKGDGGKESGYMKERRNRFKYISPVGKETTRTNDVEKDSQTQR